MVIYGKQFVHTRKESDTLFLCPYAFIEDRDDGIFVGRYDESEGMIFAVEEQEDLFHILAELKSGIKEDTLLEKLSEFMPTEEGESFLEQLMQKGIIE